MPLAEEVDATAPVGEAVAEEAPPREAHAEEASLERLLAHVPEAAPAPTPAAAIAAAPALRMARVLSLQKGRGAEIAFGGRGAPVAATLDEGVDREVVARALTAGDAVLVEIDPEAGPVIVGVVQRRVPDTVEIRARKVVIDADEELLLRAGRGALRIREDGDVELVGSRISTLSRGLFRIVGRVLRLN